MKEQELNNLLDKAIGTKGDLRIHSYWMRKIFKGLIDFIKSIPKVTKVSQLTNDVNYATLNDIPTKTSQLINNSDFVTTSQLNDAIITTLNTSI